MLIYIGLSIPQMDKIGFCGFHVPGEDEKSIFRLNNQQTLISLFRTKFVEHQTETVYFPSLENLYDFLKAHPNFKVLESRNVEPFIIGEIGIWGSWYLALSSFIHTDLDWLVIYEDDLWLGGLETVAYIDEVIRSLPPLEADFLALSALEGEFFMYDEEIKINQYFTKSFQSCCLGLSVISKKAALYILEKIKRGIDNPIDLFIFGEEFELNIYSLIPTEQVRVQISLFNQKWLGSTINLRKSDNPIYVPYPL